MPQSRQLAAIMFTDIVGYTALMGEDEEKAFDQLKKNRRVQKPIIEKFNGRWLKEIGDGVLATFNSVSDAVYCAKEIQKTCEDYPDLNLRIGIHLGEVVFEKDDVFGDGVNIAARIQGISRPGSIYISESVHNNVSNKLNIKTKFVREEMLKNVTDAIRIYEVLTAFTRKPSKEVIREQSQKSKQDSIGVLPFVNMSNDPEQDYFCDGISEEIINSLAQLKNLRVTARTSVFSFKGKNIDMREIGKTLDVSTLLEGSVRKSGGHLRITVNLIGVSNGAHLWSKRYDRELKDIFSIQEDIARNVATELTGYLSIEDKEVIRPHETVIEAYDYYLRGRQLFHQLALDESKQMFEKAIGIDPSYAPALSGLSDAYSWIYEWEGGSNDDLAAAEHYSMKALSLAPKNADSHSSRGYVLALGKRHDEAEQEFKEAIRLNPNLYEAYYYYGRSCFAQGQVEKSVELFRKASEVRQEDYQSVILLAQSLSMLGKDTAQEKYRESIVRIRKQLELDPKDKRALYFGALGLLDLNERDEAFKLMNEALELYPEDMIVLINGACFFARDGNTEKALRFLEIAFEKGYGKREWIENDPDYDSLRDNPRFKALLEKLK